MRDRQELLELLVRGLQDREDLVVGEPLAPLQHLLARDGEDVGLSLIHI